MNHVNHLRRLNREQAEYRRPYPSFSAHRNSSPLSITQFYLPGPFNDPPSHCPNCATYQTNPNPHSTLIALALRLILGCSRFSACPSWCETLYIVFFLARFTVHAAHAVRISTAKPRTHASITKSTLSHPSVLPFNLPLNIHSPELPPAPVTSPAPRTSPHSRSPHPLRRREASIIRPSAVRSSASLPPFSFRRPFPQVAVPVAPQDLARRISESQ